MIHFEGLRTEFPHAVASGTAVPMRAYVQAPPRPGRYRLVWDVVAEGRLWFSSEAPLRAYSLANVTGPSVTESWLKSTPIPPVAFRLGRGALWQMAVRMWASRPLLGVGPDNFRLLYGQLAGSRSDPRIHTNNMYLEVLVGGGVLAGAAFLWLCWRAAASVRDAWRLAGPSGSVHLGIAAAVAAIFLHGLVDSFLSFTPTYLAIWLTLGLVAASAACVVDSANANRI